MYKMNSNSNDALYAAVEDGSLEKLNEAAASGADVNFLSDKRLPGWKEKYVQRNRQLCLAPGLLAWLR